VTLDHYDEGLLAAYALDAVDRDEAAAIEAHLHSCSRCHRTAVEFLSTAAQLAIAFGLVIEE
jgi:anti-sigma factor RsiW